MGTDDWQAQYAQKEIRLLRRLSLLKYLQNEPMRISDIAYNYGIDDRTIRSDIDALRKGMDFLGVTIKIESKHQGSQQHYYKSTLHPIFLALNLGQLLALLKLLEEASKEPLLGDTYQHIFDTIYSQITDYAEDRIKDKLNERHIKKRSARSLLEEDAIRESDDAKILYYIKKGIPVTITLKKQNETIHGVIIRDFQRGRLWLRMTDGKEYKVRHDDIVIHHSNINYQ